MPVVGGPFEHDIFVTYSHGTEDEAGVGVLKRWSEAFVEELQFELDFEVGRGLRSRLFFDAEERGGNGVDPVDPLTDQLRERIRGSATLLVLMSPDYVQSKWCRKEREWWFEAQVEFGFPTRGRLALATIRETPDTWPKELLDSGGYAPVGFNFIDRVKRRPLEWPRPHRDSRDPFRQRVGHLASVMREKLASFREVVQARNPPQVRGVDRATDRSLFLFGRPAQEAVWATSKEALTLNGFSVRPEDIQRPISTMSPVRATFNESADRVDAMVGCDAVLLLATSDLDLLAQDMISIGRNDRNQAKAKAKRELPCAVLDVGDVEHKDRDARETAAQLGIHWVPATSGDWPLLVQEWLDGGSPS